MMTMEKRRAELRVDMGEARGKRKLFGYAARYGVVADIGAFRERISPGAFAGSIGEGADILALLDHDAAKLLGRTRSKTLRLADDDGGLAFDIDVPETSVGRDALVLAVRGDIGGASIGFIVEKESRANDESWGEIRVVERARLLEISIVSSWPAYAETTVEARGGLGSSVPTPRLDALQRYLASVR